MNRTLLRATSAATIRVAIAAALIACGWAVGSAQTAQPDFELIVNAPAGETTVECRGCELVWSERGVNPAAKPLRTFMFKCTGRCSSGEIAGWIKR